MIKIIVHAFAEPKEAAVEIIYASKDEKSILEKMAEFEDMYPNDYLATYDLPLDVDLFKLAHYPSVSISPEDFDGGQQ